MCTQSVAIKSIDKMYRFDMINFQFGVLATRVSSAIDIFVSTQFSGLIERHKSTVLSLADCVYLAHTHKSALTPSIRMAAMIRNYFCTNSVSRHSIRTHWPHLICVENRKERKKLASRQQMFSSFGICANCRTSVRQYLLFFHHFL